jgi:chitin disaccharide deacetylase
MSASKTPPEAGSLEPLRPGDQGRSTTALLIVDADDYGLTEGISRGILRAHRDGVVSSTSALVVGRAFERTARWLRDAPELGVGVHLAAVGDDPPLLSRSEIATMVDRRGRLPRTWRSFLGRAIRGGVDPDDLSREFAAQIEAARQAGIVPTHLDTHQHLHLWPMVATVVLELAVGHDVAAVRVPSSPVIPLRLPIAHLAHRLRDGAGQCALACPELSAGIDHRRLVTVEQVCHLVRRLSTARASAELVCHPGEPEAASGGERWEQRREQELRALTSPVVRWTAAARGFRLGTYAHLRTR